MVRKKRAARVVPERGRCSHCRKTWDLLVSGFLRMHYRRQTTYPWDLIKCEGSYRLPEGEQL